MTQAGGSPTRVVMFVMNDLLNDPRVQREARSAVRAGFRVTVVAMQSARCHVRREMVDGYEVVRVRYHRSILRFLVLRLLWLGSLAALVLVEGFKLAVGLPPGPKAPGQDPTKPSIFRQIKWATFTFLLGVAILVYSLVAFGFLAAFIGFLVMFASVLWLEHNARKLGRAGLQHGSSDEPNWREKREVGAGIGLTTLSEERLTWRFHSI